MQQLVTKITTVVGLAIVSMGLLSLQGCAHHQQAYMAQSSATPPLLLPKNVRPQPLDNQYPVPPVRHQHQAVPSLVPPGADLEKYKPVKKQR